MPFVTSLQHPEPTPHLLNDIINMKETNPPSLQDFLAPETFDAHLIELGSIHSNLFAIKQEGWKRFLSLPMPTRKNECWRFAEILDLNLQGFHLPEAPSAPNVSDIIARSNYIKEYAGRLIFADNHLIEHTLLSQELSAQGVIIESLDAAWEKYPELLKPYFLQINTQLGGEKFEALHHAYAGSGTFIYVPKGVILEKPIVNYYWMTQENSALFPYTLIVADESSEVNVVDFYLSTHPQFSGFSSSIADTYALKNAQVRRYPIQNFNANVLSFQIDHSIAHRDADVRPIALNLGGKMARMESQIRIEGENSHIQLQSLTVSSENQHFDQRTLQIHSAPHAVSNLLYKNALLNTSKTIFSGLIQVAPEAQKTDAYQTNRNLLLSPEAEAVSLPGLEILANDVKCSHGATSGQLDQSELFYMLSRGITQKQAQTLLIFGFFEEVLSTIKNPEIAETLRHLLQEKLLQHLISI